MKSFFHFFAERHLLASLITIMVLLFGINAILTIKRDLFPKVALNEVIITTFYPGASPEDVELSVTNKIETFLKPVSGIKKYTSYSMENMSLISVHISPDLSEKQVDEVVQEIRNAVARVKDFPKDVLEAPTVDRLRTSEIPVIEVGLSAENMSYRQLREHARILEKKIKNVAGVSKLDRTGYRAREVSIELSPAALNKYQISMREIILAIQARNIRGTGGTLESYVAEKDIMTLAQFRKPQEVGDVIVRSTFEGPQIKVKDLAIIKDDFEEKKTIARINGKPAISFTVYKTEKADIMRTVERLKNRLAAEKKLLPEDLEILYSMDTSRYVEASYDVVKNNAIMGILLVLVVLAVFLNARTAFWVALGIPVSILGAIALLPYFDVALDVITLSAMILVLGILVDDAIIISENISRRRELGDSPVDAAVNGLSEVFGPVVTTIITTLLAFSPMFFIPGEEGKFVFPIPLVITLTLLISLVEGVFALPAHVAHGGSRRKRKKDTVRNWFDPIRNGYQRLMKWVLKLRYVLVLVFVFALFSSIWYAANKMEVIVFPNTGAEEFTIFCELPVGYTLEKTSLKVAELEQILDELPKEEIESYVTRVGTYGDGTFSKNSAVIAAILTPYSTRNRNAEEIAQEVRDKYAGLADFKEIYIDIEESGPAAQQPVILNLIGSEDNMRNKLATDVMDYMASMGTLQDIRRNDKSEKSQIEIKLNYEKLARLGLTVADVAQNVRIAYDGEIVTKVRYGEEDVEFRVVLNKKARGKMKYLRELAIPNMQNRLIPLREVARFRSMPGATDYRHHNGERVTTISAELIPGKTTPKIATQQILSHFNVSENYPGMYLLSEGAAERTDTTLNNSLRAFMIAIIGIYFLLMILFNSITQPLLVMLAIPFGFSGIVLIFGMHNEPLSFMGMLGIIGLSGVVVNDSLVLVDRLNTLCRENPEKPLIELIARGTADRLRAILLTTITTAAGLLPLAYGIGGSDPYNAPMALALGWGLLTATPLTLMLVPSLYMISKDISKLLRKMNPLKLWRNKGTA